jgi:hypothetical protein
MKDTRITMRLTPELRKRLLAVCAKTGLDEPTAVRALIEGFCETVEQRGGIWLPLSVVPKSPTGAPSFPSTARAPHDPHSLNEPAATPAAVAPRATAPAPFSKTRSAIKDMVQKEKRKP